jgi:hypothetical protein
MLDLGIGIGSLELDSRMIYCTKGHSRLHLGSIYGRSGFCIIGGF